MKTLRPISIFIFLAVFILQALSCSNARSPLTPDLSPESTSSAPGRTVLAVYDVAIDPAEKTFEISPSTRIADYHLPLRDYFPDVLSIVRSGWQPNFWADIKISHPSPGSGVDVFDPRVIAIIPARQSVSSSYPVFDVVMNDQAILAPDGYTKLFDDADPAIAGNTNPFKAYFKNEPSRVWKSIGNTSETQRWNINLDGFGGSMAFKLVVDVSTNWPSPSRPIIDNALEPVSIDAVIGYGLTPMGGHAGVDTTILAWHGQGTVGGVQVESPDLFNGTINLSFSNPGPNPSEYVYSGQISNNLQASPGIHNVLIASWDTGSSTYIYQEFEASVTGDISFNPQIVKTVNVGENIQGLQIMNGYAYLEDPENWLSIIDIDPPESAQSVKQVPLSTRATVVRVLGDYAYIMGTSNNTLVLSVVNINPPDSAYVVNETPLPAVDGYSVECGGFAVTDGYAYVAYEFTNTNIWGTNLYKIDISSPESPQVHNWISSPAMGADIFICRNYIYITPHFYTMGAPPVVRTDLNIFDISQPQSPTYAGSMKFNNYLGMKILVNNGYAYLNAHENNFKIVDVDPPGQVHLVTSVTTSKNVQDIYVTDTYAYAVFYSSGMEIFNINPPETSSKVASMSGSGNYYSIDVEGKYACVPAGNPGFHIIKLW